MPTIALFYGIIIQMYFIQDEHNPPHIHAIYNDYEAEYIISTANILVGMLPKKADKMVKGLSFIRMNCKKCGISKSL